MSASGGSVILIPALCTSACNSFSKKLRIELRISNTSFSLSITLLV